MTNAELKAAAAPKAGRRRFLPLAILAAGFALFFALGQERHISSAAPRARRAGAAAPDPGLVFQPAMRLPLPGRHG